MHRVAAFDLRQAFTRVHEPAGSAIPQRGAAIITDLARFHGLQIMRLREPIRLDVGRPTQLAGHWNHGDQ